MNNHGRGLDRRQFLKAAGIATAAITAGGLLEACSTKPAAAPETGAASGGAASTPTQNYTLSFWNGLTGPDGKNMEALVAEFMKQHLNIKVEQQQIPWVDFYTKMLTAIPAGEGPDMAFMHTYEIPRFAEQGHITELTADEVKAQNMDGADFYDLPWKGGVYKGKRYSLPLDVPQMGLFINNAMFKKAGLLEGDKPKAPTNWDEFLTAAKAMTKGDEYGLAFGQRSTWQYELFLWQNGGELVDAQDNPTLDSPEAIEAAQFYQDLNKKHKITPEGITNSLEAFRTGKFGMMINGGWNIPALTGAKLDFTLAPMPQFLKKRYTWVGTHQFVLPPQKKKDAARRTACLSFFSWLSQNSLEWAKAGHSLARKSVVQSAAFQALKPQVVLANQESIWRTMPPSPKIIEFETKIPVALEDIFLGKTTPAAGMKALNEDLKKVRI